MDSGGGWSPRLFVKVAEMSYKGKQKRELKYIPKRQRKRLFFGPIEFGFVSPLVNLHNKAQDEVN